MSSSFNLDINEKIGFLGLGIMGKPMAKNLIDAGCDVMLFNRSIEKCNALVINNKVSVANNLRI